MRDGVLGMRGVSVVSDDQILCAYKTRSIRDIQKNMGVGIHRIRRVIRGWETLMRLQKKE